MKLSKVIEDIRKELEKPLPEPREVEKPKKRKRKMAKKASKKKSESLDEKETKKSSKKKAKGKEKETKKSKKAVDDDDGYVTIAQLAEEAEINAQSARVKLRDADVEKPEGGRWRWKEGSKALKEVRKVLGL